MKKCILIGLYILICFNLSAQILTQKIDSKAIEKQVKLKNDIVIEVVNMPSFDIDELIREDVKEENNINSLPRFGYTFDVK